MKYHVLQGKRVPVDKYDTDHLLRLILKISRRCNKFALKHTKSVDMEDGGVWVARGFVKYMRTKNGSNWELSTMDSDPLVAAEKFLTMLIDHEQAFGTSREKLDKPAPSNKKVKAASNE